MSKGKGKITRFVGLVAGASAFALLAACGLLGTSLPESLIPLKVEDKLVPDAQSSVIIKEVGNSMIARHYSHRKCDDVLSKEIFENEFSVMDPSHMFFTQGDIDSFRKVYETRLDDDLSSGNTEFAFKTYNLLLARMEQYRDYATKVAESGIKPNPGETMLIDRKDAPWPKDEKELCDLWRKMTLNDILSFRLMERTLKEGAKASGSKPMVEISPAERTKRRISQICRRYEEKKSIDVTEQFLTGCTTVLDPHSVYMSPKTVEEYDIAMKLQLCGIGSEKTMEDGYMTVSRIVPGGPADKDGRLKAGDRVIAVAQEGEAPVDIIDMPLNDSVQLIRGKEGTKVTLIVLHQDNGGYSAPTDITITRGKVALKDHGASTEIRTVTGADGKTYKIGILLLPTFYNDGGSTSSYRDTVKCLADLKKEGIDGLIFDLRGNGGGSLTDVIGIAGLFIRSGPVVQVRDAMGRVSPGNDPDPNIAYDGPMIVMVNNLSASASEIFAAAMQDYNRAIIVGDRQTYGKGSVQTVQALNLPTGPIGLVKFTMAKFYRVNGDSTQLHGVVPDIIMPAITESMKICEGDIPHALPFDTVDKAQHEDCAQTLAPQIAELKKFHDDRMAKSDELKAFFAKISQINEIQNRKELSLDEETRWSNFVGDKKITKDMGALLMPLASMPEKKDEKGNVIKQKDMYLEEGISMMMDYISISKK